jgi:transposase
VPTDWYERYGQPIESGRLPKTDAARMALAKTIGIDGLTLLDWVVASTCPAGVADLPALQTLRQVWADHFVSGEGIVEWRAVSDLPPTAEQIVSPYDVDARWSTKRDMEWIGYKVHFTETCNDETPHLLTHVETTLATTPDDNMLEPIHAQLAARDLLPREHLVDKGYTNAHALLTSQTEHGVTIIGPVTADPSWQAHAAAGFAKGDFQVDWAAQRVTCPQGQQSAKWVTDADEDTIVHVAFARSTCKVCPVRSQCTKSAIEPRQLTLHGEALETVLRTQRAYQRTVEFQEQYRPRAGIEGTHSQAIKRCDLRHARYRGLDKTRLQHLIIAVAINLVRAVAWLAELPRAQTRTSAFAALHLSIA